MISQKLTGVRVRMASQFGFLRFLKDLIDHSGVKGETNDILHDNQAKDCLQLERNVSIHWELNPLVPEV